MKFNLSVKIGSKLYAKKSFNKITLNEAVDHLIETGYFNDNFSHQDLKDYLEHLQFDRITFKYRKLTYIIDKYV